MSEALEIRGLTKRFQSLVAVDDVSFEVRPGEIYGFIGPNGAGKTTTMRICATLELPDEGDVLVGGVSAVEAPRDVRAKLGFMPDSFGAYANTTVREYLDFFARAYGLRGRDRTRTLGEVMDFTALEPLAEKEIAGMSKGMKQRLCLAKTLLHRPSVLILDEPAAGLDPRARVELRELLRALAELGKAILVSSHILTELSEMCHGVAVIERGTLRARGPIHEVKQALRTHSVVFVRALEPVEALERALLQAPLVEKVRRDRGGVALEFTGSDAQLSELLASLVAAGLRPVEFASPETDLEDVFLSLTQGEVQ